MLLGAIDIGTNAVLLSICQYDQGSGKLLPRVERSTVTRLGAGVAARGSLDDQAMARTTACLKAYQALLGEWEVSEVRVVATCAVREARNGELFRGRASEILGRTVDVLSGEQEARLTYAGALSDFRPSSDRPDAAVIVFDIGGGSTEFARGSNSGQLDNYCSLELGSVRLSEEFAWRGPVSEQERERAATRIRERLQAAPLPAAEGSELIGVAGTVTTLSALSQHLAHYDSSRVHRHVLSRMALEAVTDRLLSMSIDQLRQLPSLEPGRADLIAMGGLICREIVRCSSLEQLTVSERGVRYGLLQEMTR